MSEKVSKSLWNDAYKRLKKNKASMISLGIILFFCFIALFAERISPFPFDEQHMDSVLTPPDSTYLLGTDNLGRDLLSRIIYGARMSMAVGIITAFLSLNRQYLRHNIWLGRGACRCLYDENS